jgi:amino acid transporter
LSAWTLLLVYVSFAGGVCAATADEAQPAFGTLGLHLAWPVYAIIAFVLVMALAYLDVKISVTVILVLEGASMLLVITACSIILAKGGFHGHAFSPAPFRPNGVTLSVLGLGIVFSFAAFSGFEAASTLGEESQQPRRLIPLAIAVSLAVVAIFQIGVAAVVTNAYPGIKQLSTASVPLSRSRTSSWPAGWARWSTSEPWSVRSAPRSRALSAPPASCSRWGVTPGRSCCAGPAGPPAPRWAR